MPPVMNRKNSQERAERCWRHRLRGRTWQEIADLEGFKHRRAAQHAVEQFLKRNPPDDLQTLRRAMGDGIGMVRQRLLAALEAAEEEGDYQAIATLGRAALDSFDRQIKLEGLAVTVPTELNVNVRSAAAVLERAEQELLAIANNPQPEIVDAEVIEE